MKYILFSCKAQHAGFGEDNMAVLTADEGGVAQ